MDGRRTDRSADEDRVTPGLNDPPTRCPNPALALLAADADLQPPTPAPAALYCATVELGRYRRAVRRPNRRQQGNRRPQGTPRPQAPNVHTPTPTGNTSTSTSTTRILLSRSDSRLSPVAAFRRVPFYDGEARLGSPQKRSTVGAKHCGTRWAARCAGRMDGRRTDRSAAEDRVTPGLDDPPTRCPDPALALLAGDDDQQPSTPAPESPHHIQHQKDYGRAERPTPAPRVDALRLAERQAGFTSGYGYGLRDGRARSESPAHARRQPLSAHRRPFLIRRPPGNRRPQAPPRLPDTHAHRHLQTARTPFFHFGPSPPEFAVMDLGGARFYVGSRGIRIRMGRS
ncbi:hypothetical protein C8J57DRAFT_1467440 [Mycena rebaudengoi]|nr:hypothetical protein C8J57DRAFT_1467440 [Mycena rebaudengoi]